MNINDVYKIKKIMQKLLNIFHRFYKSADKVRYDLDNCGDEVITELVNVTKEVSSLTDEAYQAKWWQEPLELILFIAYKDTAYNEQMKYVLYKLLTERKDKLLSVLEADRKILDFMNSDTWHVNRWSKSKTHTKELKDKGILHKDMVSGAEAQFVNSKHEEDVKTYLEKQGGK